eukprot:TRINITY_DN10486_c0_g1_i1.p1 TRINITY_DN10486_c0_g1~~TRINITY_DN10486_c0_g1_i1.p1  ORF type:complete len:648 (-),score=90.29 TRINITY_DN10486_c0_g1_i1:162-2105(-)
MFGHSLRSRKIDADLPLLINHGEIPDIELETPAWRDFSAISTGMEPEEEHETHLREALAAEAAIPTPDIKIVAGWDAETDPFPFWQPPTWYIRSADSEADTSTIEYDMDEEDSIFLEGTSALVDLKLAEAEFEYIMDTLEKHQCDKSRVALPDSPVFDVDAVEHLFITKRLRSAASIVYVYWREKRRSRNILRRFTHFNSTGPFAAFVSRPGPRNQRKRRFGRDCEIYDDYHSFLLLQQLRMQSVIARDALENIVFREYRKRERVAEFQSALSLSISPGKPSACPLHVQDFLDSQTVPKFKVVFKLAPAIQQADDEPFLSSPQKVEHHDQPIDSQDVKLHKKTKRLESESSERKKKAASARSSKRIPPTPVIPRVIFLPLDSSPSDDEDLDYNSDSEEFSLPNSWPRPLDDCASDEDSLEEPEYALNPHCYIRPSVSDEDYSLSRFADLYGRQIASSFALIPSLGADREISLISPSYLDHRSANLQRQELPAFRGRRRVGRGGRVIWDRFPFPVSQRQKLSTPRLRLSAESAPKRIKLNDEPVNLESLIPSRAALTHPDALIYVEPLEVPETVTNPASSTDTPTVSPEPSKTSEQYDSSDDVILIPDAGIPPYVDLSVAAESSTQSFVSSSTSIRVSNYPFYGSAGT